MLNDENDENDQSSDGPLLVSRRGNLSKPLTYNALSTSLKMMGETTGMPSLAGHFARRGIAEHIVALCSQFHSGAGDGIA